MPQVLRVEFFSPEWKNDKSQGREKPVPGMNFRIFCANPTTHQNNSAAGISVPLTSYLFDN